MGKQGTTDSIRRMRCSMTLARSAPCPGLRLFAGGLDTSLIWRSFPPAKIAAIPAASLMEPTAEGHHG